jgi:hypothetical protein
LRAGSAGRQVFCGNCGTHLYACAIDDPQSYTLPCWYDHAARGLLTAAANMAAFRVGLGGRAQRGAGD